MFMHVFSLLQSSNNTRRGHRGDVGDASPYQTQRGVDMILDFIENHRQKYFCTAHYLIAKDAKS